MASPIWKVYKGDEYIASCKEPMYAGMIVASIGTHDMTIRYGHNYVVWHEGFEDIPASESYDIVTETCKRRAFQKQAQDRQAQTESIHPMSIKGHNWNFKPCPQCKRKGLYHRVWYSKHGGLKYRNEDNRCRYCGFRR